MGSGKTSYAIQSMNENLDKRYIYITPYLDEVERIKTQVTNRRFYEPNEKLGQGKKLNHFKKLIKSGKDIVTTHALFACMDFETKLLLKDKSYILILDEVFQVMEKLNIKKDDVTIIKDYTMIDETGKVVWIDDYNGDVILRYKIYCDNETLYSYNGEFYYWTFPYKVFELFEDVYILTYLFSCQIQAYYYNKFGIEYDYYAVTKSVNGTYMLTEYDVKNEHRESVKNLVNIYDGKMNSNYYINESKYNSELSTSWFKKADDSQIEQLRKNLTNWFCNINTTKAKENLWTTKKELVPRLKGKGYAKSYIPLNTRATNKYKETKYLAYVYNRFMNPFEVNFFKAYDVEVDQDLLAVSDLLQWIWRSQIRDGKEIDIYIPSSRMRELLEKYFNYEI